MKTERLTVVCAAFLCLAQCTLHAATNSIPNVTEALAAKSDVWGIAARAQPNGPSYEFFAKLLPPLRYVDAAFRHYPIVLSAPGSLQKARLISNGSAINAKADKRAWKEVGTPILFRVGEAQEEFGRNLRNLSGPKYAGGYLPIVQMSYESGGAVYQEENFASVDSPYAENGAVFTQFGLGKGTSGIVSVKIDSPLPLMASQGAVRISNGYALVWFSDNWQWDEVLKTLTVKLTNSQSATLAIATKPMAMPVQIPDLPSFYDERKTACATSWQTLLDRSMQIEVAEPVVTNAWRSLVVGSFILRRGDNMNYSAGNQYERLYEAECGDTLRSLMLYGYGTEMRSALTPLLNYTRTNGNYSLKFHQAAFKLQMMAHYYWVTRDADVMRELRPRWLKEVEVLIAGRDPATGLLPKEQYAGDIFTRVVSLNSNANGWRGLRDIAAVLADMGEMEEAKRIGVVAQGFRKAILAAVKKSEFHDTKPPFIPLGLFGGEQPYDVITDSKMGSYYNEMASYIIGSGVFGLKSDRENWMIQYLQEHGGIAMGLIRFHQHTGLFANENGVDDLYTLRYAEKLFERDEVDNALTSFYGKLAQGLTRDTFIGAEGTSFVALDEFGRPMYDPPNSAGNAFFLWMLRDTLVQDWDLDDDGTPETLRLGFATPRRWLEDGKVIKVEHAPTAFGDVTMRIYSNLSNGDVRAEIFPPQRNRPKQTFLRIRLPDGWSISGANVEGNKLKFDPNGTMNVSAFQQRFVLRCKVTRR